MEWRDSMGSFDHWTVTTEDYQLFFGCSREELLKDWGKEHLNILKQKAYYRMLRRFPVVTDFAIRNMYCDEDVTCEAISGYSYDFFQNLERQLNEIKDTDPVLLNLQKYQDDKLWFGLLESLGLQKEFTDQNGVHKGWRRVKQVD